MEENLGNLVRLAKEGDRSAFNGIVVRFQRRVFAAALAATGDMDEADEVTQEAFVRLFDRIGSIGNPEGVGGWLVRTAVNVAHDRRRFRRVRGWFKAGSRDADMERSTDPSPESMAARNEVRRVVDLWSRGKLSERERVVLQLRFSEEMKIDEIARELGVSPSTVKTHLSRAREKLRPVLEQFKGGDL